MKQKANTKKTLGRVWFQYFQLYGMTNKLTATCVNIGCTQMNRENFAKEHYHLVNQFTVNMVRDNEPDIPQPGDLGWLTSHPEVAGMGKAPNTNECGPNEEKTLKIQTRDYSTKGDKEIPKVFRTSHTANAIPKTGEGNSTII